MYLAKPKKTKTIYKSIDLGGTPSVQDILDAFETLKVEFPDIKAEETQLTISVNYDYDKFHLTFYRTVENENYDAKLLAWQEQEAKFLRGEKERQAKLALIKKQELELLQAKKAFKDKRRAERIASKVVSLDKDKCNDQ